MNCERPYEVSRRKTAKGRMEMLRGADATFLVPCGQCILCRLRKTFEWGVRLLNESDYYKKSCFLTLTYDDEYLPDSCGLEPRSVQLFMKRLRKELSPDHIKSFYVGEYGDEKLRPHYHFIIYGWMPPASDLERYEDVFSSKTIQRLWPYGYNTVGFVEYDSVMYVAGYVQKKLTGPMAQEVYGELIPPFMRSSHGIGERFCMDNEEMLSTLGFITVKGHKLPLPRYYRDKLGISAPDPLSPTSFIRRERQDVKKTYGVSTDKDADSLILEIARCKANGLRKKLLLYGRQSLLPTPKEWFELKKRHAQKEASERLIFYKNNS